MIRFDFDLQGWSWNVETVDRRLLLIGVVNEQCLRYTTL